MAASAHCGDERRRARRRSRRRPARPGPARSVPWTKVSASRMHAAHADQDQHRRVGEELVGVEAHGATSRSGERQAPAAAGAAGASAGYRCGGRVRAAPRRPAADRGSCVTNASHRLLGAVEDRLRGQTPSTSAATTTMPEHPGLAAVDVAHGLVLRLVERAEHQLLEHGQQVHRRQDHRASPRWRPAAWAPGRSPTMPVAAQVLLAVKVPISTRNSPTKPRQAGQADRGQHDDQEAAPRSTGICVQRPPKSASWRVWRRS